MLHYDTYLDGFLRMNRIDPDPVLADLKDRLDQVYSVESYNGTMFIDAYSPPDAFLTMTLPGIIRDLIVYRSNLPYNESLKLSRVMDRVLMSSQEFILFGKLFTLYRRF